MKIEGWEKISGYTYKGFCIVNPIHNANEEVYYATVLNLNHEHRPKWDITLVKTHSKGVVKFSILDNVTQHLLAKSHLTKVNIETPQKFREQYEMLVDDILEEVQSYTKTGTTGPSQGIINQVQTAGTTVAYSSHSISNGLSNLSVMQQALNAMKELEEQLDELKKQYPL